MVNGAGIVNNDWASGSASYYKVGKQCVVNAVITIKQQTIIDGTLLISGLPVATKAMVCLVHGTSGYGVFTAKTNGTITVDQGAQTNAIFYFEMMYPVG